MIWHTVSFRTGRPAIGVAAAPAGRASHSARAPRSAAARGRSLSRGGCSTGPSSNFTLLVAAAAAAAVLFFVIIIIIVNY